MDDAQVQPPVTIRNSCDRAFVPFPGQISLCSGCALALWLSGNALASINEVNLRRAQLVLGWMSVQGQVNHYCM